MVPGLLSMAFSATVALLLAAAAARLALPLWRGRPHAGVAYAIAGIGLASLVVFVGYWMHPLAGDIVSLVVVAGAVAVVVVTRAWRLFWGALPALALAAGVLLIYVSLLYFWGSDAGSYGAVTWHFGDLRLPPDNTLPFLFSEKLAAGESTHLFFEDWNGSDRPPLQAGFILLIHSLTAITGSASTFSFGASVICQLLWVPALFAFVRACGSTRPTAIVAVLFAAGTGTVLFNTLYTWPKLLSAALVLSACVLLVDAIRRPRFFLGDFVSAVVVFVLAMLSHGAAAFAVPLVVWLGVLAYRRQSARGALVSSAAAAGAGILVYLPWTLFQRLADPPGDRLLKWHLLGLTQPDDRGFLQAMVDQFSRLTPGEWLELRWLNLTTVVELNPLSGVDCLCADAVLGRRSTEFFTTTTALGLALVLCIAILAVIVVRRIRRLPTRRRDTVFLFTAAASAACILFWCVLMYGGGTTVVHQGSHVWILLLLAAPIAWMPRRRRWISWLAVAVQAVILVLVYLPQPLGSTGPQPAAAVVAVAGALLIVVAWRRSTAALRPV